MKTNSQMPIGQDGKHAESEGVAWVVGVGASRGNGAAVARRFAHEGFEVAVTGRSSESLQAIAAEIEAAGGRAIAVPGDVRKESDILEILGRLETIGPVEVGIYNAGNAIWSPPLEMSSADFDVEP
jgi:NAD(P)-dependent dehydrogenase (short-subunit alcohol dehydrogenase family)